MVPTYLQSTCMFMNSYWSYLILIISDLMLSYHGVVGDSTTPIITLELISESSTETNAIRKLKDEQLDIAKVNTESNVAETCFLAKKNNDDSDGKSEIGDHEQDTKSRHDFMEYLTRSDGSVVCKLCGEVLQSRTHWYRHKYKLHVIPPLNPAPLYQCDQCLVFFKSRKGNTHYYYDITVNVTSVLTHVHYIPIHTAVLSKVETRAMGRTQFLSISGQAD